MKVIIYKIYKNRESPGIYLLIGNLHHGETNHLFPHPEALLEDLHDGALSQAFVGGVHHRVVQVGIEGVSRRAEALGAQALEIFSSSAMVISTPFL